MSQITGTIVNYYFHCKRQCWLFANRINLEDNSEDVRMGKVLHELADEKRGTKQTFSNTNKYDHITEDYVIEMKKSDSDIESAKWQLIFYLYELKNKGVVKKGKLEFTETNKQKRKTMIVILDNETEEKLIDNIEKIKLLITSIIPPDAEMKSICKKCAYYEYCFI
jgi:CRISPR-associated exonuclease Cas4